MQPVSALERLGPKVGARERGADEAGVGAAGDPCLYVCMYIYIYIYIY